METGVKEVTLLGFDALQYGDVSNVYSGATMHMHLNIQRKTKYLLYNVFSLLHS